MSTAFVTTDVTASSRRWLAAAAGLVFLVSACIYALKAAENASAILRWRDLIQSVVRGENVYNEWTKIGSFPYPPFAGLVLWPLTLLPPITAGLAWFVLKVGMAAVAIRWSIQLAWSDDRRFPLPALMALLALVSRPFLSDLQHGNINILILFLTTAGLLAFRNNRDWLAGLMIALATSIKLTPALFIPYFAYKRQWRVVAWSLAGLLAFLFVVPGAVLGFERNWWLLKSWSGAMVEPYMIEGKVETLQMNQSLPGVWMRLVTDSPGIELEDGSTRQINILSLDHRAAVWSLKALMLGLLISIAWLCRTPAMDRCDWRLACEYGLIFIAMLLISERSWKHHFVTMLLPYTAVLAYAWRDTRNSQAQIWIWAILTGAFFAMASTSTELGGWLADGNGHKYAQAYGLFCASAVLMFAVLAVILARAHAAASRTIGSESCDSR